MQNGGWKNQRRNLEQFQRKDFEVESQEYHRIKIWEIVQQNLGRLVRKFERILEQKVGRMLEKNLVKNFRKILE